MPFKDPHNKAAWYSRTKEYRNAKSRAYYHKNREEILIRKKADRLANPEKYTEEARRNYARNKEKIAARFRIRYKQNPQYFKDISARYVRNNRQKHLLAKRERRLKENYGIDLVQYDVLLKSQDSRCVICGILDGTERYRLSVDHNHKTKENRGLLCSNCNRGIGHFKENLEILEKAKNYLLKYETKETPHNPSASQSEAV